MPIYEYRCSKGHEYERAEGFDAPTEQRCLKCGGTSRRLISMPAVIFKGSGFYSTDNRKDSSFGGNGDSSSISSESDKGKSKDGGDETKAKAEAEVKTAD